MKLAEAVAALALGVVVAVTAALLVATQAAAARGVVRGAHGLEVARLVAGVLDWEVAGAERGTDLVASEPGLAVRAYRGWLETCGPALETEVTGSWRGLRAPDPSKDSLLLVHPSGRTTVVALEATRRSAGAATCSPEAEVRTLEWGDEVAPLPAVVLVRVFERGDYALDDAFRYRRGAGGRQPLTPAVLDPDSSELSSDGDQVRVGFAVTGAPAARRTWLR